jgi:hypothetical protein
MKTGVVAKERSNDQWLAALRGPGRDQALAELRNALYKLLHDARKRLRRRMSAEMLSPQDVLSAFGEG